LGGIRTDTGAAERLGAGQLKIALPLSKGEPEGVGGSLWTAAALTPLWVGELRLSGSQSVAVGDALNKPAATLKIAARDRSYQDLGPYGIEI
jgi:hypothetical protein